MCNAFYGSRGIPVRADIAVSFIIDLINNK